METPRSFNWVSGRDPPPGSRSLAFFHLLEQLAGAARDVKPGAATRWRRLARMTEAEFVEAVESGKEETRRHPSLPVPQLVMMRTPWSVDRHGVKHRQAFAVEAPSASAG